MSWSDYVDAAQRKAAIANFHCDQLRLALADCKAPHDGRPDVATQAFFEGVVVAAVSAIDQVAQAANSALRLGLSSGNLFAGASPEIESRVPEFKDWREDPIGRDLRRLRTRMVHYSYCKSATSAPSWQVEVVDANYAGPRELLAYAEAAAAYAQRLGAIAERLRLSLAANS
ncbi:hypothetical protein [Stenotrophomonas sp. PS02297]|uniref:hypothetical protein n=1 Tax=unclassified Stenotrophomonas TaxID=196198 RepID=UPI00249AF3D3|nr:hypothetical protein [Stenotrophomonas sp. PS02297]